MTQFDLRPNERTTIFIDGPNLYASSAALNFKIDFRKMLNYFKEQSNVVRANYYSATFDYGEDDTNTVRPLLDFLDYNGYNVVSKAAKEFTDANGRRKIKGNMDIEIAVDMLAACEFSDHLVLFSGDGDFTYAVDAVQRRGKRVTVLSTKESSPPMIADELRRQADMFIDIADMINNFSRPEEFSNNRSSLPASLVRPVRAAVGR